MTNVIRSSVNRNKGDRGGLRRVKSFEGLTYFETLSR